MPPNRITRPPFIVGDRVRLTLEPLVPAGLVVDLGPDVIVIAWPGGHEAAFSPALLVRVEDYRRST